MAFLYFGGKTVSSADMKIIRVFALLFSVLISNVLELSAKDRVLLIPLDNRPPCLQFPVRMGQIADLEIITPPASMLGNLETAGDTDAIMGWINEQPLKTVDGVIIVADMLAYGGLVASRKYAVSPSKALDRLALVKQFKENYPAVPVFMQSVIMRLAPTADGTNDDYREKLAAWAATQPSPEKEALQQQIPEKAIQDYKAARSRNHLINSTMIDWVKAGYIDFLVLSQDDAKPAGLHVSERESLARKVATSGLKDKIAIQAGTDEVAMLLLSRLVNNKQGLIPVVSIHYSSKKAKNQVMPFEDQVLSETILQMITCAGGTFVEESSPLTLDWFVYTSRNNPKETVRFLRKINQALERGQKVIISDIDPVGNVQGGAKTFTEGLIAQGHLSKLYGYASWNTAGNTLGTALPQGMLYHARQASLSRNEGSNGTYLPQYWFTIHRVINDYVYNNTVRADYKTYFGDGHTNASLLSDEKLAIAKNMALDRLHPSVENIIRCNFAGKVEVHDLNIELPWRRAFEALIDFDLNKKSSKTAVSQEL